MGRFIVPIIFFVGLPEPESGCSPSHGRLTDEGPTTEVYSDVVFITASCVLAERQMWLNNAFHWYNHTFKCPQMH